MDGPGHYHDEWSQSDAAETLRDAAALLLVRGAATVHDALAEPLAAWLTHQAQVEDWMHDLRKPPGSLSTETTHALAVARVILGSAD